MSVAISTILSSLLLAQSAVYHKPVRQFSPQEFVAVYKKLYNEPPAAPTGLQIYKVSYPSPRSPKGNQRLSGALYLPSGEIKGTVLYCHGTITTRDSVGSRATEMAVGWAAAYVAAGFAVVMPDYIGLGDSATAHPYPLGRINAWSSLDMLPAADLVGRRIGRQLSPKRFVAGYSEGGAIAMWVARLAQENKELDVEFLAAAPQSGPYDLSDLTAKSMVSSQSNPVYLAARQMLVAYIGYSSVQWIPRLRYRDLFVPSFASYVPAVFRTAKDDGEVAKRLAYKAFQIRPGAKSVQPILQPAAYRALRNRDLRHPLIKVLADHDSYDWSPKLPMRLYALEKDYLVTHENTEKAYARMLKRGVSKDLLSMVILPDEDLNHVSGELPIAKLAAEFFATFL